MGPIPFLYVMDTASQSDIQIANDEIEHFRRLKHLQEEKDRRQKRQWRKEQFKEKRR